MPRRSGLRSNVHQHEAARAIRVFRKAPAEATLPEESRLLVAGNAANLDGSIENTSSCLAIDLAGGTHFRQNLTRHTQQPQQFLVPISCMQIKQHGPRGVAGIGYVQGTTR